MTIKDFSGFHSNQLGAWKKQVELLHSDLSSISVNLPQILQSTVIFEFPMIRLQKRLDVVLLLGQLVVIIEFKTGDDTYRVADIRQVEDYALDIHDFHEASHHSAIFPILCVIAGPDLTIPTVDCASGVHQPICCNGQMLHRLLSDLSEIADMNKQIDGEAWEYSPYRPVPTIVRAAEMLFAGHSVREIANASSDPGNLTTTTDRLIQIMDDARSRKERVIVFVTGVPGSGKTLVGLNTIHDPRFASRDFGHAAFLSGNTPLVTVLREALAQDKSRRTHAALNITRREVRTKVQGLMNFLEHYLKAHPSDPPDEHVVVFDEAQRAWDAKYGFEKFERPSSEPALFLEIMERRADWAVIVGLVGGGQEINKGERGLREWGDALLARRELSQAKPWRVVAAPDALTGGDATAWQSLFPDDVPPMWACADKDLHLGISVRSYRCLTVTRWVNALLEGHVEDARAIASDAEEFPIFLTRSLAIAREWLRKNTRGSRRCGLTASSGARRLRAEGLGVSLSATELGDVANWYLCGRGDIRSSYALEVTSNEYTCQGLELDYVGVCWDGDMVWQRHGRGISWTPRQLRGNKWQTVGNDDMRSWIINKYRVLLTRARLGTLIWVPGGDTEDSTRLPVIYDNLAEILSRAGARGIGTE